MRVREYDLSGELGCGAEPVERRQEAVGAAVMSEGLDREAAERAARNLGRARVIAKGLELPLPDVEVVSDEREAFASVVRYLARLYGTHLRRTQDTTPRLDELFDRLLELESRLEELLRCLASQDTGGRSIRAGNLRDPIALTTG